LIKPIERLLICEHNWNKTKTNQFRNYFETVFLFQLCFSFISIVRTVLYVRRVVRIKIVHMSCGVSAARKASAGTCYGSTVTRCVCRTRKRCVKNSQCTAQFASFSTGPSTSTSRRGLDHVAWTPQISMSCLLVCHTIVSWSVLQTSFREQMKQDVFVRTTWRDVTSMVAPIWRHVGHLRVIAAAAAAGAEMKRGS